MPVRVSAKEITVDKIDLILDSNCLVILTQINESDAPDGIAAVKGRNIGMTLRLRVLRVPAT